MKKVTGKYDETSARFGFHEWGLELGYDSFIEKFETVYNSFIENFETVYKKVIREGMEIATKEYKCHAWLPAKWDFGDNPSDGVGGKPPSDPTTIYVELPLGADDFENPRWSFTLVDLIDYMLWDAEESGEDGKIADNQKRTSMAIRDSLRALADRIDSRL